MHQLFESLQEPGLFDLGLDIAATDCTLALRWTDPGLNLTGALITVLRLIPVVSATADFPPRPSSKAIAPATTRRCSSFRCGRTVEKNRASSSRLASTKPVYIARTNIRWTLSIERACPTVCSDPRSRPARDA